MALYDVSTTEKKSAPSLVAGGTLYADSPVGTILPFGGTNPPSGFLLCQGQEVSKTTYAELYAVIGDSFGTASDITKFVIPDMRESVPKGAGLTGHTVGAHLDADGLALGEFLDDRIQVHTHSNKTGTTTPGQVAWTMYATNQIEPATEQTNNGVTGRFGATTEVKSVGVNYIIKAKMVAMPSDFMSKVDEAVDEVLTPVTGTATPTAQLVSGTVRYIKSGNVCTVVFTELTVSTSESNRLLCSGLPLPLAAVFFVCDSGGNYYTMNITGAGELRDANNIVLGDKSGLYGSATYICK